MNSNSDDSKTRILAAAELALLHTGAGGLRVDQVAAQAGVNKRMVYHYFGDRQGLVEAVIRQQFWRLCLSDQSLSETSRALLRCVAPAAPEVIPEAAASADQLTNAARIVLMHLCTSAALYFAPDELTAPRWLLFTFELMSLAFADIAAQALQANPSTDRFRIISERLLTTDFEGRGGTSGQTKPRYRMTPVSRFK